MKRTVLKVLFFSIILSSIFTSCIEKRYVENPKVGDVYLIEEHNLVEDHPITYSLLKVKEIKGDSLIVVPNYHHYHDKVYCLASADHFIMSSVSYISKDKLKKMFDEGTIVDVIRLYEKSCLGNDK